MPDFGAIVRRLLGRLPLAPERAEEIVLELAHQMEDAHREALARGLPESQAEAEAMAQLGDPEKLRSSIVSAERGEKVLWPHPWAVPRPVCWLALAMLAALCLIPNFRQALRASASAWSWGERDLTDSALQRFAARGLADGNARLVAFCALHLEDEPEANRLAERAVAMDPSLTWIGTRFIDNRLLLPSDARVDRDAWAKRVVAWDPENAFPRLLASEQLYRSVVPSGLQGPADDPLVVQLAEKTSWGEQMRAAFRAPRYDSYSKQKFELEKSVLTAEKALSRETLVWCSLHGAAFPDSTQVQRYSALVTGKLGPDAEQAKHYDEASEYYWSVARFGERMEHDSEWPWQKEFAWQLQRSAYGALGRLAERTGNAQEKAAFDAISERLDRTKAEANAALANEWRVRLKTAERSGILAWFSAWMILLSLLALVPWAALAGLRRSEEVLTGWRGALAMATSYAPGLLLGSSVTLYLAMMPFLRSPEEFVSQHSAFHELAPFWFSYWSFGSLGPWGLYAGRILGPAALSLTVLVLGIMALYWLARHRAARAPQV